MITQFSEFSSYSCKTVGQVVQDSDTLTVFLYPLVAFKYMNNHKESFISWCLANSRIVGFSFVDYVTLFQLLFGLTAIQTISSLRIAKSNFDTLQATSNNTAESLLVGLLLQLLKSGELGSDKVLAQRWKSYVNSETTISHVLTVDLWNILVAVDDYELPEINDIVKASDY